MNNNESIFVVKSRKGYQTRMSLLGASFDLIAENGLQTLTIASICERIGLQRSSFYNHFDHLHALLDTLVAQVLDDIGQRSLEAFKDQNAIESMLEFRMRFLFELGADEPGLGKVLYELYTFYPPCLPLVKARISGDIKTSRSKGFLDLSDRSAKALTHIFVASIIDGLNRLSDPHAEAPDVDEMIKLLFKAAGRK